MDYKILIISHNVFNETQNMGRTLLNFFSGLDKNKIAQLYFQPQIPRCNMCKKYYRVTDVDLLTKKKEQVGKIYNDVYDNIAKNDIEVSCGFKKVYDSGKKRKPYKYVLRNLLWDTKKWSNYKLNKWIDDFDPDVIFFAAGDYVFAYKVVSSIAKRKQIPVVTYFCDDYYFLKQRSISPLYWLNRMMFRTCVRKLLLENRNIVGICDKLSLDYSNEFGVRSTTVMTSSIIKRNSSETKKNKRITISYIGNLSHGRIGALKQIGRVLEDEYKGKILVNVYSAETRKKVIDSIAKSEGIDYRGSLTYQEVIDVTRKTDILLHVESMNEKDIQIVKYSISTKIADALSYGKCVFAYGPAQIASIEYLHNNKCACIATSFDELKLKLKDLIENKQKRDCYGEKALMVARQNHNFEKNKKAILKVIKDAVLGENI